MIMHRSGSGRALHASVSGATFVAIASAGVIFAGAATGCGAAVVDADPSASTAEALATYPNPYCDPGKTWGAPHMGFSRCHDSTCDSFTQFETRLDKDECQAGGVRPGV